MSERTYDVLFLCTGNSARSIMAEALLRAMGEGRFRAHSAGSRPKAEVHPLALKELSRAGLPIAGLRAKSWDEFAAAGAPVMDFVFTVCDGAAGEACPVWPGRPVTAHWGIEDPAAVRGDALDEERAFVTALRQLKTRISLFAHLKIDDLDAMSLRGKLDEIGRVGIADRVVAGRPEDVVIYHNPDCGTSRNVLALVRNAGVEPHVVEYLKSPPSRAMLSDLIARMGITPRDLLREKGTPFHDLGLGDVGLADDALVEAMMAHPILINRPIVVTPKGVRLCRPSEVVLELLPPQLGAFAKEDGEKVVDERGLALGKGSA